MPTEYDGNLRAGEPPRGAPLKAQDTFLLSKAGGWGEERNKFALRAGRKDPGQNQGAPAPKGIREVRATGGNSRQLRGVCP